jgi:hypothetical protein
MRTQYPKQFEKYYAKHHSYLNAKDLGEGINASLKAFAFHAWSSAAKRVSARIGAINRWSNYSWQHEDVDGLHDYTNRLYKDE